MAVYAIVGRGGSGKTAYANYLMRKFYRNGEDIYTNIRVIESEYKLSSKNLGKFYHLRSISEVKHIYNAVIVIDEMPNYFEARDWQKLDADDRMKFQTQRHDRLDIFYTAHNFGRVDLAIRQTTHVVYEVTNFFAILFIIRSYDGLEYERSGNRSKTLTRFPRWFILTKNLAQSYDDHQWRRKESEQYEFETMSEYLKNFNMYVPDLDDKKTSFKTLLIYLKVGEIKERLKKLIKRFYVTKRNDKTDK